MQQLKYFFAFFFAVLPVSMLGCAFTRTLCSPAYRPRRMLGR
jgi:hypothetical protein